MGQKVNPHGLRIGIIKEWDTKWYADKKAFADFLVEDYNIRKFLKEDYIRVITLEEKFKDKRDPFLLAISKIYIDRTAPTKVNITIHTGRPAVLIGKAGDGIKEMKKHIEKITKNKEVTINVVDVKKIETDAQLVAEDIAKQLEARIAFRRAMKQAMGRALRAGVKGIKTQCSGRLNGAEIARSESYREGSIPLQTLRANIDYGFAEANTTFGKIGVKVWIYKGEILNTKSSRQGGDA